MSTAFRPGQCLDMIEQLEDADVKRWHTANIIILPGSMTRQ